MSRLHDEYINNIKGNLIESLSSDALYLHPPQGTA